MVAVFLQACALADIYNMQGMEGTVVDKATKKPIEGVIVIEEWGVGGGFEGNTIDYLPLRETQTDGNGRYVFTARGTEKVAKGFLTEQSPWLTYYKPGYAISVKNNRFHQDRRFEYNRRSDWDGKTIELMKLNGALQDRAKELERLDNVLNGIQRGVWCNWMSIPRTLMLMRKEYLSLKQQNVRASVSIGAPWVIDELKKCSSSDQFFEIYKE